MFAKFAQICKKAPLDGFASALPEVNFTDRDEKSDEYFSEWAKNQAT